MKTSVLIKYTLFFKKEHMISWFYFIILEVSFRFLQCESVDGFEQGMR